MKVPLLVLRSVDRTYNTIEMMAEVSSVVSVECVSFQYRSGAHTLLTTHLQRSVKLKG